MNFIDEQIRVIESISSTRALAEYEQVIQNDEFMEDADRDRLLPLITQQEARLKASEAEGLRFQRAARQKEMIAALSNLSVMGSGITIKKQGKGGRLFTPKGSGFSVPSGSSESLSAEGSQDALMPAVQQFVERYVKPNMTGNYVDPGSSLVRPQVLSHDEVVDKLGIVPPDAGRAALEELLKDAAADGGIEAGDIEAFAKDHGLPKTVAAHAKAIAKKSAQADAEPSPAKAQKVHLAPKREAPSKQAALVAAADTGAGVSESGNLSESDILTQMIKSGRTDFGTAAFSRDFDAAIAAQAKKSEASSGGAGSAGGTGSPPSPPSQATSTGGGAGGSGGSDKQRQAEAARSQKEMIRAQADGRKEMDAVMAASHKSGAVSDEDYEAHLSAKAFDSHLPSAERRSATSKLGAMGAKRQTKAARDKAAADREDKRAEDFAKKTLAGAEEQERKSTEQAQKDAEKQNAKKGSGKEGFSPAALGRTGALAALGVLHGVTAAFGGGMRLGAAAGALVTGLSHAFTGAASGFVHVGDSLLSLVLSPFGASGQAVGKLAAGLGQSLVSALSAGGGVLAAGVKIGVGLSAGILSGLGSLAGAGIGAVLGGILGSVLPGGGTIAGALLGAGIGGAVAGAVLSALAGIAGSVSSALGSALGAVGDALAKVGGSIGDALGSVKSVLSDLIDTGAKFASAMLSVSRGGNLSLGAAGGVASLSQMLTGSPGGLNGVFTGFGHMSQYQGFRLRAFGVGGATGGDPLGDLVKSADAYRGLDPIRRSLLVNGGYEGNDAIGNLFALNAYAPGLAARAASVAQKTALTPKEAVQNATLALNLSEAQSQLDRLKTRLLTDLMPALNGVLGVFSKWFTGHEKEIVSGLEAFGKWVYVKLPTYLGLGMDALLGFGQAFSTAFPKIFSVGLSVLESAVQVMQKIAGEIGGNALVKSLSPTLASGLTGFSQMSLSKMGLESPESEAQRGVADRRRAQAAALDDALGPLYEERRLKSFQYTAGPAQAEKRIADLEAEKARLLKEADDAEVYSRRLNPLNQKAQAFGQAGAGFFGNAQNKADSFLGGAFGTEAERAQDWKKFGPRGSAAITVNFTDSRTFHHTIDMTRLQHSVTEYHARQAVQAFQEAGA